MARPGGIALPTPVERERNDACSPVGCKRLQTPSLITARMASRRRKRDSWTRAIVIAVVSAAVTAVGTVVATTGVDGLPLALVDDTARAIADRSLSFWRWLIAPVSVLRLHVGIVSGLALVGLAWPARAFLRSVFAPTAPWLGYQEDEFFGVAWQWEYRRRQARPPQPVTVLHPVRRSAGRHPLLRIRQPQPDRVQMRRVRPPCGARRLAARSQGPLVATSGTTNQGQILQRAGNRCYWMSGRIVNVGARLPSMGTSSTPASSRRAAMMSNTACDVPQTMPSACMLVAVEVALHTTERMWCARAELNCRPPA